MAIYGAGSPPPRRYGCRTPRSRALHALLLFFEYALPPPLPLEERLLDFLYDLLFLFFAGAFDAAFDDAVRVRFLVLDVADAAVDVLAFLLLEPDAADEDDDLRGFLLAVVLFESSPFLLDNRNPLTPAPEPPMTSFRPLIHE
eukprot:CAMPEP_0196217126 /NCGR_PEP_ID=MMETSP0912-20130531/33720_1 /TAXON_ID=49265 /ORGANISM="Thalassiosira rotula, Strain GSO102" /LENGTH=142 /DNA_ID=CAMNT_0041494485 /DNA_START=35 /DNA_END=460 /DNA_ORIENTATION=-